MMLAPSSSTSLSHMARFEALETEFNRDWGIVYSRVRRIEEMDEGENMPVAVLF